jgi:hypothetical protein
MTALIDYLPKAQQFQYNRPHHGVDPMLGFVLFLAWGGRRCVGTLAVKISLNSV